MLLESLNIPLSLHVWSQKIVTNGALLFQFLGIPNYDPFLNGFRDKKNADSL